MKERHRFARVVAGLGGDVEGARTLPPPHPPRVCWRTHSFFFFFEIVSQLFLQVTSWFDWANVLEVAPQTAQKQLRCMCLRCLQPHVGNSSILFRAGRVGLRHANPCVASTWVATETHAHIKSWCLYKLKQHANGNCKFPDSMNRSPRTNTDRGCHPRLPEFTRIDRFC